MARALWPAATSSSAAARMASSWTSARTTAAFSSAKALAVARPMPEPAPVTKATLPSNEIFIFSFAISRLFQCLFCSPVSVQFTSYRNLKTSSSQVLTGSCSDCRIPAVISFIDLVSPQYWAQAAEYCYSGQKKDNTAAQVNAQRQPNQKIRVTPEGFLRRQNKEFDLETKTRLGDTATSLLAKVGTEL